MLMLDTTHPAYDFAMEVLCLLPVEPAQAPMRLLCADLQVDQGKIRKAFKALKEKGIRINVYSGNGFGACISPQSWTRAQMLGNSYVDQLTGVTA